MPVTISGRARRIAAIGAAGAALLAAAAGATAAPDPAGKQALRPAPPPGVTALEDTGGTAVDAVGDSSRPNADPPVGSFYAPDIESYTANFVDNGVGRVDDDVVILSARVNNDPGGEFTPRLYDPGTCDNGQGSSFGCYDTLQWYLDTDGNSGTGDQDGAEWRILLRGDPDGVPDTATVMRWSGGWEAVGTTSVGQTVGSWFWQSTTAALGIVRGRDIGVQVYTTTSARVNANSPYTLRAFDYAPDRGMTALRIPGNPKPPTAATGGVASASPSTLTVTGTVNPLGAATGYRVRYSRPGVPEVLTAPMTVGEGTSDVGVSATLSGLQPSTTYRYQIVATSPWGETAGAPQEGRTADADAASFGVSTADARNVGTNRALLSGTFAPQGQPAAYFFEWGTSRRYGKRTARSAIAAGRTTPASVGRTVTRLAPGTTYHYRLVIEVNGRRINGSDESFTTRRPDRLVVSGDPDFRCFASGAYCRLESFFAVAVRIRSGVSGRVVPAADNGRGVRVRVRCTTGCRVNGTARLRGRTVLSGNVARLFGGAHLRPGATIEVRATRSGVVGGVWRVTLTRRLSLLTQTCEVQADGRVTNCERV